MQSLTVHSSAKLPCLPIQPPTELWSFAIDPQKNTDFYTVSMVHCQMQHPQHKPAVFMPVIAVKLHARQYRDK